MDHSDRNRRRRSQEFQCAGSPLFGFHWRSEKKAAKRRIDDMAINRSVEMQNCLDLGGATLELTAFEILIANRHHRLRFKITILSSPYRLSALVAMSIIECDRWKTAAAGAI
jgi:hypothetical protein